MLEFVFLSQFQTRNIFGKRITGFEIFFAFTHNCGAVLNTSQTSFFVRRYALPHAVSRRLRH
jgi:hypothetical protein